MSNPFPMHEGVRTNKIMDERDEEIAKVHAVPPHVAGFVFVHSDECFQRNDYTPNINCKCFDWSSPEVTRNVLTVDADELAKIKQSMENVKARRREPLPVEEVGFELINPDPGYSYEEWVAYMDGLISGLKAAERNQDEQETRDS